MYVSRTGGWSLPGVMSDWQRCVYRFLAKHCRCRLRFDWCWCRWRTSVKGRCRWGLVWRRQVDLVQGTRWPAELSAGRMVARTAGWNRGRFLGWALKQRSCRDLVGAESWVVIGGGYIKFARFAVIHQKTIGLVDWATKLRPKTGRVCQAKTGMTWLENHFGVAGHRKLRGGGHASGSQRLHRGYAKCGHRASVRWCYKDKILKCPWWVCILV
jgi:hypothetical protein